MIILLSSLYATNEQVSTEEAVGVLGDLAAALPQLHSHLLSPALERAPGDPVLYLRMVFATQRDYEQLLVDPDWSDGLQRGLEALGGGRVEKVLYEQGRYGLGEPDIEEGIWRALIFSVLPGVDRAERAKFERAMHVMADYVTTIRNWSMSKIIASDGSRSWDYVWEQDFQNVEGLLGEYRTHPIHWGYVDRWFDVENPQHIIDSRYRRRIVCASPRRAVAPDRRAVTP